MIYKIKHTPEFYYYRAGKIGSSDKGWILNKLQYIPESRQQEVCENYTQKYLSSCSGRKDANQYLYGVADEYRRGNHGK